MITLDRAIPDGMKGTLHAKLFDPRNDANGGPNDNKCTAANKKISIVVPGEPTTLEFEQKKVTVHGSEFTYPGDNQKCLIEIPVAFTDDNVILGVHPHIEGLNTYELNSTATTVISTTGESVANCCSPILTVIDSDILITIHKTDDSETHELKVAKWENSFDPPTPPDTTPILKDEWINPDDDSFYIQVKDHSKKGNGHLHVMVCTVGNADTDYDDPETKIVLKEILDGNGDPTGEFDNKDHRFILVSDTVDDGNISVGGKPNIDNQPNNGTAPADNDRTHLIQLGGEFVVKYIPDSTKPDEFHTRSAFVERKKTVTVNVFILKKLLNPDNPNGLAIPVISQAEVKAQWKVVRERYAQVGVWVQLAQDSPKVVDQPQQVDIGEPSLVNVDLSDGLTVAVGMFIPSVNTLDNEARALIKGVGKKNEVNAYYVNKLNAWDNGHPHGVAVAKSAFSAFGHMGYFYNFFVATERRPIDTPGILIPSHELGHCVGELLHPGGTLQHDKWRLMYGGVLGEADQPTDSKRLSLAEEEETKIQGDPHAK